MKDVPYVSAIGSIMYTMLCTRPNVCVAISLAGRYQSNPGVDHRTLVKIIMFLGYGGDKKFVVKSYVDASFDADPDDSKSQSRYILKVGAIS